MSTSSYTFYNPDGSIKCVVCCAPDDLSRNLQDGCAYVEGNYDARFMWCPGGVPTPLAEMTPTVTGMVISGLPTPLTRALIELTFYETTDGSLEVDSNLPGPYSVRLMAPGHFDKEVTIT